MDSSQFDQLTKTLAGALSRRLAVGTALGGTVGALFNLDDMEAKKKKKKRKKKRKKKKGKGKASPCTNTGSSVSVVTEGKYKKKPLRLQQDMNFGNGTSRTEVLLAGKPVVQITYAIGTSAVITTVTYGGPFAALGQARFETNEQGTTGTIGGRPITPLPPGANASQLTFADGGGPLNVAGDPGLSAAIQGLFSRATAQASACNAARARSISAEAASDSPECIGAQALCGVDLIKCGKSVVDAVTACNVVPVFGPIACAVVGSGYCAYEAAKCARAAKYGSKCCPVRCGGDVGDIFGKDPKCCAGGQACQDPNSNQSACCPSGMEDCNGTCCPTGSCAGGLCCTTGVGAKCGDSCCGPFSSCCGGRCCSGICNGTVCCTGGQTPCGNGCCNGTCCNGNCCPRSQVCCGTVCCLPGADCRNGQCVAACLPGQTPCHGKCCPPGEDCQPCPNGSYICSTGLCVN